MTLPTRTLTRLKALVVILTAIFFAQKYASGTLYYYIGPRFGWLTLVAVLLLIMIGSAYDIARPMRRVREKTDEGEPGTHENEHAHDHTHEHAAGRASVWPLLIMLLPLALGVAIPARPLGASAIASRGIATDVAVTAGDGERMLTIVPGERNVLDWVRVINTSPDPAALDGEEADVVGFVYRDVRFADDQFMVARFTITCCVADASAIGLVVQAEDAGHFAEDSWVRVQGRFAPGSFYGGDLPVLIAEAVTPVQPPEHPYLYP